MSIIQEDKHFIDCAEVKAVICLCAKMGGIFSICSFGFAAFGVIGDAVRTTLGLESILWFSAGSCWS